jgi:hypothetical protein
MDQPASKTMNEPTSKTHNYQPISPDEYYAKRLLIFPSATGKIRENNGMPENIREVSINFHRDSGRPRNLNHFRALVTEHEELMASLNHKIRHTASPCPLCQFRLLQGSIYFHKAPRCNALHLSSLTEDFFNLPPPDYRREAFEGFKALLADNSETSLIGRLGAPDARSVSPSEYVGLLNNLSAMFFPVWGKRMTFEFAFLPVPDEIEEGEIEEGEIEEVPKGITVACCTPPRKTQSSLIQLSPRYLPRCLRKVPPIGALNPVSMTRLGVLLHEMCHALLFVHACHRCPESVAAHEQLNGHGFAWQRIALMVEREARSRLEIPLHLGRAVAIQTNWQDLRVWPSQHEVQVWFGPPVTENGNGSPVTENGNAICKG